jgi:hypothetical protein
MSKFIVDPESIRIFYTSYHDFLVIFINSGRNLIRWKRMRPEDGERRRDRSADITLPLKLKPINEQDKKKGCKMTLGIVCFMEFLVRIMQKLPDDLQDVLEMPLMGSEDPVFFSVDALYSSS